MVTRAGQIGRVSIELPPNDNILSFGQCIALILLAVPGLGLLENYFGKTHVLKLESGLKGSNPKPCC